MIYITKYLIKKIANNKNNDVIEITSHHSDDIEEVTYKRSTKSKPIDISLGDSDEVKNKVLKYKNLKKDTTILFSSITSIAAATTIAFLGFTHLIILAAFGGGILLGGLIGYATATKIDWEAKKQKILRLQTK